MSIPLALHLVGVSEVALSGQTLTCMNGVSFYDRADDAWLPMSQCWALCRADEVPLDEIWSPSSVRRRFAGVQKEVSPPTERRIAQARGSGC